MGISDGGVAGGSGRGVRVFRGVRGVRVFRGVRAVAGGTRAQGVMRHYEDEHDVTMEHACETVEATIVGSVLRPESKTAANGREAKRDETPFREPVDGPEPAYGSGEDE